MNQHDLANPFRMFCQEDFKRVQLLRNTLDVVKTVNTDDQLDTLELLLKCLDAFHDLGLLETFLELLRIDTDRECTNSDDLALKFDCVGCCWKLAVLGVSDILYFGQNHADLQDSRTTAEEVSSIIIGVESDQIAV